MNSINIPQILGLNQVAKSKTIRILLAFLQAVFGFLLFRWILQNAGLTLNQLFAEFVDVSAFPLMVGVIFFILTIGLRTLRFKLFLSPDIPIPYLCGVTLLQNAVITFIPWRIGEVSYPLLLNRDYKISLTKSTATIFVVRSMDFLLVLIAISLGLRKLNLGPIPFSGLMRVLIIIVLVVLLSLILRPKLYRNMVHLLKDRVFPLPTPKWITGFLIFSVSIFITSVWQSMFILEAVALRVSFDDLVLLSGVTLLSALVPIHPPGGWGTIDSIQVVLLDQLGYSPNRTAQSILIAHAFFSLIIFFGGVAGWLIRKLGRT